MAQNIAVETLMKERQKLFEEKERITKQLDFQIQEIETAIDRLDGKKVWTTEPAITFDDENPDYIRGSIEN